MVGIKQNTGLGIVHTNKTFTLDMNKTEVLMKEKYANIVLAHQRKK